MHFDKKGPVNIGSSTFNHKLRQIEKLQSFNEPINPHRTIILQTICQICNGFLGRSVFLPNFIFSQENFSTIIILSNETTLLLKVLKDLARL